MALVVADRVKETTTTTGTGTYTLAGAATGFESFSAIGNANTTYYCCTDGTDFEVGIGTYTASGTTLARTTILQSSNSDAAVNWSAGTRDIFVTQPAEKAVFLDGSGNISIPGTIDGRDLATDGTKLDGIEANATADQTASEIRTLVESASDSNVFTDADHTKLNGIEASADVTDTTNVTAAGALMDSEVTNLAQVKAFNSSDYATAAQGSTADSAMQDLSDDTSPTLGGALDTGGNQIKLNQTSGTAILTTGNLSSADLGILRAATGESGTHGFTIKYMGSRTGNNNSFSLFMDNQTGTDVEAITVLQDGKVGINKTTPTAPLDVTGNIVVSGTVDGRDLATDGTKLDGIEASADVTDTANVTAAGALMDSEVTNLAQVKAFDSSDYATAAQGTTADAALPKAGGTMTGNLELNNVNIVFEGSTADANETTLTAIDPTADRTISLPNQSGTAMVTIGDSYRSGVSQTYSGSSYLVDGEYQEIATVTPSGNSHNYFFAGRIIAQSGQNVHKINISVALRSNTLPDLSWTINYDEDVIGTTSQYITPVLFVKETSPASFILAVEVHNTIYGTLTADLDFFARTQADLADISVNTTDGSEITAVPTGYTAYQFTKTTALDNSDQFVFNQDVQFTGDNYNVVWDKSASALEFADNAVAAFGAGDDLKIYHDGSNSYVEDAGTGNLNIKSTFANIFGAGGTSATFYPGNAVTLYYNNVEKLATTADGVEILSTDAGASAAPSLQLYRNSASPADDDDVGQIQFYGENDAGEKIEYGRIDVRIEDASDGSEDGQLDLAAMQGGSSAIYQRMSYGLSQFYKTVYLGANVNIQFEGANYNNNETILTVTDPTADRTITLPDATGTVQLTDGSGASLTSLNASELSSGTVPNARLDAQLQDVAGLAVTNGGFIVGDGSNFVLETGATARTSLGLGTAAVAATGISNGNVPVFTSGVADDDFLRVNGTSIEGRSATEVVSDLGLGDLDFGLITGSAASSQDYGAIT